MFTLEGFINDCKSAAASGDGTRALRDILTAAVADPAQVLRALGEPKRAGVEMLHRSDDLTILNVVWGPHMTVMPHNHHMTAVIGMYGGREDNIFWRRLPEDARHPLEAAGVSALLTGDVCPLGPDIIHSVTNPLGRLTGAIHVYRGDFVAQHREEWDEETLTMRPFDYDSARQRFEDSNRMLERQVPA